MRSSTFVDCNGVLINTMSAGPTEARPVLLLNALGTDLRIWNRTSRYLEHHVHVVRFDARGHGLSDAPPGPYTIEMLADDVAELINALALERPVLCGLSLGGMVAQAFAVRYPQLLSGLILIGTSQRIGTRESWQERIDLVRSGGIEAAAAASALRWFSPGFLTERPEAVRGWTNLLRRCPVEGYLASCELLRDTDLSETMGLPELPTLAMAGELDPVTPPAEVMALAQQIDGARFELLEGLAHFPQIERPDLIARHITDFVNGLNN